MRNLKISRRLTIGFGTVFVLLIISTVIFLFSLNTLYSQITQDQDDSFPSTVNVWTLRRHNISLQRYMALVFLPDDAAQQQKYIDKIASKQAGLDAVLVNFRAASGASEETLKSFDAIMEKNTVCQERLLSYAEHGTAESLEQAKKY